MKSGSIYRIHALLLRYLYVLRSSWPRIIEISYWPTMQLIIWGFVSLHFGAAQPEITASGILISVVFVKNCIDLLVIKNVHKELLTSHFK